MRCGALVPILLLAGSAVARAQDPVRLPGVVIQATPELPGPHRITGFVRDTSAFPLDGAEVTIPSLQRRTLAKSDGSFAFADVARGTYAIRAKKLGYAPQTRTVAVSDSGATGEFALLSFPHSMPAVLSYAARGGLSGVIADTSYQGLPGVQVAVLGKGMFVETDSLGAFYLPAPPGSYMVAARKAGFAARTFGVTIPSDSGRYLTASLYPSSTATPVREAWNLVDLGGRLAGRNKQTSSFYTRQELKEKGIEWVHEAVVMGGLDQYDVDCHAVLNGGPSTIDMSTLTVDDIESIEIYGSRRSTGGARPSVNRSAGPSPRRPARFTVAMPMSNAERAEIENGARYCATVYVWTR